MGSENLENHLLKYFEQELNYLKTSSTEFAKKYPHVAQSLGLNARGSSDPETQLMIESFAYLTGKIQYQLDDQYSQLSSVLLENIYPHLMYPIPSMNIQSFRPEYSKNSLKDGVVVPKGTTLRARSGKNLECIFKTVYPVTLLPLEIMEVEVDHPSLYGEYAFSSHALSVVRIRLKANNVAVSEINLNTLRFYFSGDLISSSYFYNLLFNHCSNIAVLADNKKDFLHLGAGALKKVGFAPEENLLPLPKTTFDGFRLLQEYLFFQNKFYFCDIDNLNGIKGNSYFDILLFLDETPKRGMIIDKNSFALYSTPVINLFPQLSEPIMTNKYDFDYNLNIGALKDKYIDIHSVESVYLTDEKDIDPIILSPFYSIHHVAKKQNDNFHYILKRDYELEKTKITLSFVDHNLKKLPLTGSTIYADLLCTNATFAAKINEYSQATLDESFPVSQLRFQQPSTAFIPPVLGGNALWELIASLSLNHHWLSTSENTLELIKNIFKLYGMRSDKSQTKANQIVGGIKSFATQRIVRRMGNEAWRGFVQGTEIIVELEEEAFAGTSFLIFLEVLNEFFKMYAAINSFTQLTLKNAQQGGVDKKWIPNLGNRPTF